VCPSIAPKPLIQLSDKRVTNMKKNNVKIKIYQSQKLNDLNVSAIKTNLALCYHADKEGLCYPTKKTLERLTGMSKRSIYRAITALIDAALIREEFTNMSGVTVYRVTRRGSFLVMDCADISAMMDITGKDEIIRALDSLRASCQNFVTPDKNSVTPKDNSVTPDKNSVTPEADSVTPYTSYREKDLTLELELDTMKHLEPIKLTVTEEDYFNSLWKRYSERPSSLWRSDNALEEFKGIYSPVKSLFNGKKNLVTELRAFDAYLLELEAKRTGKFNPEYQGAPFIYAGRGWLKGLTRWLEAPTPATLGQKRRQIISVYGIKVKRVETIRKTEKAPERHDKGPRKDIYGLTMPPRSLEAFTGCSRSSKWVEYMLDMIQKYPDLNDRVNRVSLDAVYWTEEDKKIIKDTPELDYLDLWGYFTPENLKVWERGGL